MSTTPPVPTIDPNAATTATTTPPAAAATTTVALPEPYKIDTQKDGQIVVSFETGEKFTGPPADVLPALAKSLAETKKWGHTFKTQSEQNQATLEQIRSEMAGLKPPPVVPILTDEQRQEQQLQSYLLDQQAKALGYDNADAYRQDLEMVRASSIQSRDQMLAASFHAACPEFPASPEASATLMKYMDEAGIPVTLNGLKAAHAGCVQYGLYQPLTPEQIQQQYQAGAHVQPAVLAARTPPPMLPGTQPEGTANLGQNFDPWRMDTKKLGEILRNNGVTLRR